MPIKVAVPKEIEPGERRVAMEPGVASRLLQHGVELLMERGAADAAYYREDEFGEVRWVDNREALYGEADVVLKVQPPTEEEIGLLREGTTVVGTLLPSRYPERVASLRDRKATSFALELIPRISRAQAMDVLSSQASVAGYKAAIMGSHLACRFFPMLTTAAGTIRPAQVMVIGAGVAGLQAVATARRLGAVVEAYDVRSATKDQVKSLGARFIELSISAEGEGGYARELSDEERRQQQEELARYIARADVLITTASVPGRPAPKIVTQAMVDGMKPGAVLVDLAAEGGGNCELTQPGETIEHGAVVIHAPLNVPSQVPLHASEMYAKNLYNFLSPLISDEGELAPDWDDEVVAGSLLTRDGEIKHEPTRSLVEGGQS